MIHKRSMPGSPRSSFRSLPSPLRAGVFLLALLLAGVGVARAGVRDEHPNLVGGELLGRGLALTLNYERSLTNQFSLGAGFMAIGGSGGTVAIMPLYASFYTGDKHSLYLSGGITILGGQGSAQDFESTTLLQMSVGYHFQSRGGFFVRPFFTYIVPVEQGTEDEFLIWPGLTIGGSF